MQPGRDGGTRFASLMRKKDRVEDNTTILESPQTLATSTVEACLVVLTAGHPGLVGRTLRLDARPIVIGREETADLPLDEEGISRRHVRIERDQAGSYRLSDLDSTNGTFVNGRSVSQTTLQAGDRIQIGRKLVLKFSIQDQVEEAFQRTLYDRATRDGLTGTYNKKFLLDSLGPAVAHSQRHGSGLALLMIDLDYFKKINDTYGHPAGDLVLREAAVALGQLLRTEDLLARYGGEEFAVLLRDTLGQQALVCAERCRQQIEKLLFDPQGARIRATISVGIATLPDPELSTSEQLIEAADQALYAAKRLGRNRCQLRGSR
jgi:diguanylate cyclase (GGDEF)-like protein